MSTDDPFRRPSEELAALTKEISEVRLVLRELAGRLAQIERHVKRAFGVKSETAETPRVRAWRSVAEPPSMSGEEALQFFDRLVDATRADERASAEKELEQLSPPNLRLLARE